jgi:hypothetical protein
MDDKAERYDLLIAKGINVPKPLDYDRLSRNRKLIP